MARGEFRGVSSKPLYGLEIGLCDCLLRAGSAFRRRPARDRRLSRLKPPSQIAVARRHPKGAGQALFGDYELAATQDVTQPGVTSVGEFQGWDHGRKLSGICSGAIKPLSADSRR